AGRAVAFSCFGSKIKSGRARDRRGRPGVAVPFDPVTIRPVATPASTLPSSSTAQEVRARRGGGGGCPEPAMDGRRPELGAGCAYSRWASPLPPRRAARTLPEQSRESPMQTGRTSGPTTTGLLTLETMFHVKHIDH